MNRIYSLYMKRKVIYNKMRKTEKSLLYVICTYLYNVYIVYMIGHTNPLDKLEKIPSIHF